VQQQRIDFKDIDDIELTDEDAIAKLDRIKSFTPSEDAEIL